MLRRAVIGAALALVVAPPLAAEEQLVRGMGRTLGWTVAGPNGALLFRDCAGRLIAARDGKVERATGRCPAGAARVEAEGVIAAIDRDRQVLVIRAGSGEQQGFYVKQTGGTAIWAGLQVGAAVRVTGPVAGRAARIEPL